MFGILHSDDIVVMADSGEELQKPLDIMSDNGKKWENNIILIIKNQVVYCNWPSKRQLLYQYFHSVMKLMKRLQSINILLPYNRALTRPKKNLACAMAIAV